MSKNLYNIFLQAKIHSHWQILVFVAVLLLTLAIFIQGFPNYSIAKALEPPSLPTLMVDPATSQAPAIPASILRCAQLLRTYLSDQGSPLSEYAHTFAQEAYRHNLDCRLVAAIAGQESSFGRYYAVPYNAWGWGGGWDPAFGFTSWEQGIQVISEALDTMYCKEWNACNDPFRIGPIYAEDPNWPYGVSRIMGEMKSFAYTRGIELDF